MAILSNLSKYKDFGLLLMRAGMGVLFMFYGYPKLLGGPAMWTQIGGSMKNIGVDFYPVFWGLMAAITETFGGFLLILGLAFRPVNLLLAFTMFIAALYHYKAGDGFQGYSHALEAGIVFLALIFIGPGKYSVDKK
jgi:putative oxidoreductase